MRLWTRRKEEVKNGKLIMEATREVKAAEIERNFSDGFPIVL